VAFNNAGAEQEVKPAAETWEEESDRIIAINLRGVFLCLKYEIPLLPKHGGGAIVNTSSGEGCQGRGRGIRRLQVRRFRPQQVGGAGLRSRGSQTQCCSARSPRKRGIR
jgi:NAD(P)-dependent dehydrogenase (short-subunit alcohol dehydrogenase family)